MSDENTAYYRAAGKSLAAIHGYLERRKEANKTHEVFAKRFGAKSWSTNQHAGGSISVCGLHFDSPPDGWKKMVHRKVTYDFHVPSFSARRYRKFGRSGYRFCEA